MNVDTNMLRDVIREKQFFEVRLGESGDDGIYTDLTGRVDRGGIFISTYDPVPVDSFVSLEIHFPDGSWVGARGVVDWIKEYNPHVPEMVPGVGIRLLDLSGDGLEKLRRHACDYSTILFDNAPSLAASLREEVASLADTMQAHSIPEKAPEPLVMEEDKKENTADSGLASAEELERLPAKVGLSFFSGLVRDVEAYLEGERRLHEPDLASLDTRDALPLEKERAPEADPTSVSEAATEFPLDCSSVKNISDCGPDVEGLVANVIPWGRIERQFHGGFSDSSDAMCLFVGSFAPRSIGTSVNVFLRFPNGWVLKGIGKVEWVRRYNARVGVASAPPGMGVVLDRIISGSWETARACLTGRDGYLMSEEVTL